MTFTRDLQLTDAGRAGAEGPQGGFDDDLAYVGPWGFDVTEVGTPMLVAQGGSDRVIPSAHGEWLVRNCRSAELRLRPKDGHISILNACAVGMDWLRFPGESA